VRAVADNVLALRALAALLHCVVDSCCGLTSIELGRTHRTGSASAHIQTHVTY
jgi:hypothetical protein